MWPKELGAHGGAASLVLERVGGELAQLPLGDQRAGAVIDDRQHVAGLVGLEVTVAASPHDLPSAVRRSAGRRRTRKRSWTSASIAASAQDCGGSVAEVATVVVA
jgi:hypothetical protein